MIKHSRLMIKQDKLVCLSDLKKMLFISAKHMHMHFWIRAVCLFLSGSPALRSPNSAWFPPHRKTSFFPYCLRLSAILCGPRLNAAPSPKISPHGSSERDRPHRPQAHSLKNTGKLSCPRSFISNNHTRGSRKQPTQEMLAHARWCNATHL